MSDGKMFWMGEDVDTLPREKLLEIIVYLNRQLEMTRGTMKSILEINGLAREELTRLRGFTDR
jgi:hypothetical protein